MYLQIKIATKNPDLWSERAKELEAKLTFYDPKKNVFVIFVYSSDKDINTFLNSLLDRFPDADILDVSLTSKIGTTGYRRVFSEELAIVSPGLDVEPRPGEIIIESEVSFGSGYHPSTELCIKLIPEAFKLSNIKKVFDLGTGSGVLALCAAYLGAEKIIAVDIDFRACKEAKHNVFLNRSQEKILIACGSYEVAKPKSFDLLLANLTIGIITTLAPEFPNIVKNGGLAILSGFTSNEAPNVLKSLSNGKLIKELSLNNWKALLVRF